jgi:hypothetical protein
MILEDLDGTPRPVDSPDEVMTELLQPLHVWRGSESGDARLVWHGPRGECWLVVERPVRDDGWILRMESFDSGVYQYRVGSPGVTGYVRHIYFTALHYKILRPI